MSARPLTVPGALARHALLLAVSGLLVLPFVWMISLSLKPPGEIFQARFSFLPEHWYALENYGAALSRAPFLRFLANGAFVCATTLLLQILICAPAGYALAKHRFPWRDTLFAAVLIALLLPRQVLALPLFILCWQLGILDSYAAQILPFVVSPFGIFLFRQCFKAMPDDVVHAARLDGLPELDIVFRIMLPMALPAVIAFGTLSVVSHWNDLFWPFIVIRSEELMPPTLGVVAFRNDEAGSDFGPLMAGATLVVAPLIIAFLTAQRWFVEGLTIGAIK